VIPFWLQVVGVHPKLINDFLDVVVTFGPTVGTGVGAFTGIGWLWKGQKKELAFARAEFTRHLTEVDASIDDGFRELRRAFDEHNTLDIERFDGVRDQIDQKVGSMVAAVNDQAVRLGVAEKMLERRHTPRPESDA
jgi:hypothetical protein